MSLFLYHNLNLKKKENSRKILILLMTKTSLTILLVCLIVFASAKKTAKCTLKADSPSTASGYVEITQENSLSNIMITGTFNNVAPANAQHGFHAHADGVITPTCSAAGGHFNPNSRSHGRPSDAQANRHVGDLGNVMADANGMVTVNISDAVASLYDENDRHSIIGKALVLHENPDDYSPGVNSTGNAGGRLACCIVEESGMFGKAISLLVSGLTIAGLMISI